MKKILSIFSFFFLLSCQNFGQLSVITDLPLDLKEVSGIETTNDSDLVWMINDSGNQPKLYGVNQKGQIEREIWINAKNIDWEDLTADSEGNIYIGDFGNNKNDRKNLRILKIDKKYLNQKVAEVEEIKFKYEDQKKFPPKKKKAYFDAESFFFFKGNFYVFTKTRVDKKYGETNVYKIPDKPGKHKAKRIDDFDNGKKGTSWITSAAISKDGKKVALLSQKNVLIFSDFKKNDFFKGKKEKIKLDYYSQIEALCFLDNKTLLLADERVKKTGGNLFQLKL